MKRILICIILIISVLMLLSCNNVNIDPNAEKIYEYSYITGKDGIIKNNGNDNQVYISLGRPLESAVLDSGSSFVKEYNERVYTVNDNETSSVNDYSLYKSTINGEDSAVVVGSANIPKGSNLTYQDSWNNGNFVDSSKNFIAIYSHIFFRSNDGKLHRITENGNEDTILTPDDKAINIKFFNGWVYYLDYNFELKRIRPDGSDPETVASGISIKDYEIDEKNNDIVLQTDKDKFYLLTDDLKMSKMDFSIEDFVNQKNIDGVSVSLAGFEQNKVFLVILTDLSLDEDKDYIISFDINDPGNQQNVLTDNITMAAVYYYYPRLLDNYIYFYNGNTNNFCRIDINTLNIEEIGEPFQHEMPPNNVPNVTY